MRSLPGRQKILHLFINLTRWLHTVHTLSLLAPPPAAMLMQSFYRPSPYSGKCVLYDAGYQACNGLYHDFLSAGNNNTDQCGQVELVLHFNSVRKAFQVPGRHLQELLDVYGLLHTLRPPGAICCASLHVSIHLKHTSEQHVTYRSAVHGLC